jgi:DNA invertase Pin-like site-specific DNA recombinase
MSADVVIYRRVSTDDQAESGNGLEGQLFSCERYCEQNDLTPLAVFTDDGISGKVPLLDRPAGAAAAGLARERKAIFLVKEITRLTRNAADGLMLPDLAIREGWPIYTAQRGFINTADTSGFLMNGMEALVAEHYRRTISDNTKAALHAKLRRGEHVGRYPEVDPAAVLAAQALRADGSTYQQIAEALTEQGFTPPRAARWNRHTVKHMVTGEPWGKVSRQMMKEKA